MGYRTARWAATGMRAEGAWALCLLELCTFEASCVGSSNGVVRFELYERGTTVTSRLKLGDIPFGIIISRFISMRCFSRALVAASLLELL